MADKLGLSYYLPEKAVPRTVIRIPGSHTIYIGPLSCTRRHFIHNVQYSSLRDFSSLFITEADVASGHYEDVITESISTLCSVLDPVPHIFILEFFCIDDFIGTDEAALLQKLKQAFPDKHFAADHINPVSMNEPTNLGMRKHIDFYSFIEPSGRDNGINFLGNFVSLDPDCELLSLLKEWGYGPVRELFNCKTYEEYQMMGRSRMTIVFRNTGINFNAHHLRDKIGIPEFYFPNVFDAEQVAGHYNELASALGCTSPDFSEEIDAVGQDVANTLSLIGDIPIAVDCGASLTPFSTALALLGYGFNIRYIFKSNSPRKTDPEEEKIILEEHSAIIVSRTADYNNLFGDQRKTACLAIGQDSARILQTNHYVNMWHDEGHFGFHGIHKLMREIREAYETEQDWSKIPEKRSKK